MPPYRGRFGLTALTTPEAFVVWLVLTAGAVAGLMGLGAALDWDVPQWAADLSIALPLGLVALTPRKRR